MLHLFQNARCDMLLLQSSREVHGKAAAVTSVSKLAMSEVSPQELNDQLPSLDGMGTIAKLDHPSLLSLCFIGIVCITNHKQPTINLCQWETASLRLMASLLTNGTEFHARGFVGVH